MADESSKEDDIKVSSTPFQILRCQTEGGSRTRFVGKQQFVPAIEGLRGFAVLLVMVSHVVPGKEMLGTMGVGVFFVLSGFLITGVLQSKLDCKRQDSNSLPGLTESRKHSSSIFTSIVQKFHFVPTFYLDRFVRLTPALLLMILATTTLCVRKGISTALIYPDALSAFFYVHNSYPVLESEPRLMRPGMFLNTWSLAVEEQFYIFWSLAFVLVESRSIQKRATAYGILIATSFYIRHYSGYAFLQSNMYGIDYRYAWTSNVWKMFLGCSMRMLPIPQLVFHPLSGTVNTVALTCLVYLWGWRLPSRGYDFRTEGAWLELFTSLVVVATILGSLSGNKLLESRVLRFTGRISYSWYLWQFPLQAYHGWPTLNWGPTGLAFMVATFSTFIIEEPLRQAYHRYKGKDART